MMFSSTGNSGSPPQTGINVVPVVIPLDDNNEDDDTDEYNGNSGDGGGGVVNDAIIRNINNPKGVEGSFAGEMKSTYIPHLNVDTTNKDDYKENNDDGDDYKQDDDKQDDDNGSKKHDHVDVNIDINVKTPKPSLSTLGVVVTPTTPTTASTTPVTSNLSTTNSVADASSESPNTSVSTSIREHGTDAVVNGGGVSLPIPTSAGRGGGTTSPSSSSSSTTTTSSSESSARQNWKKVTRKAKLLAKAQKAMTTKVKLENKVGTLACELPDNDPLKVIALALQRSLRDFGRISASSRMMRNGDCGGKTKSISSTNPYDDGVVESSVMMLEGTLIQHDTICYQAEPASIIGRYNVNQPYYQCQSLQDEEFSRIRRAFGASEREYYSAMGLQHNRTQSDLHVISSKDASGKSNSFFFLTPGQRYMLKLCTEKDVETMCGILSGYRHHVEKSCYDSMDDEDEGEYDASRPRKKRKFSATLLPRAMGLYSLKFPHNPNIPDVVLVAQVNFFAAAYHIHKKFDLKGSTHGRKASYKERQKRSPVFKDLDWINEKRKLRFRTKRQMIQVQNQLSRDAEFLSSYGLIDYSLLVGIHEMDADNLNDYDNNISSEPFHVLHTTSGKDLVISYFGIVDVLTPYGPMKFAETVCTGTLLCCRDVSCQPPYLYQWRFVQFVKDFVFDFDNDDNHEEEEEREGRSDPRNVMSRIGKTRTRRTTAAAKKEIPFSPEEQEPLSPLSLCWRMSTECYAPIPDIDIDQQKHDDDDDEEDFERDSERTSSSSCSCHSLFDVDSFLNRYEIDHATTTQKKENDVLSSSVSDDDQFKAYFRRMHALQQKSHGVGDDCVAVGDYRNVDAQAPLP